MCDCKLDNFQGTLLPVGMLFMQLDKEKAKGIKADFGIEGRVACLAIAGIALIAAIPVVNALVATFLFDLHEKDPLHVKILDGIGLSTIGSLALVILAVKCLASAIFNPGFIFENYNNNAHVVEKGRSKIQTQYEPHYGHYEPQYESHI